MGKVIFYTGINPRYQSFKWLPAGLNVMHSAGGAWRNDVKKWSYRPFIKQAGHKWLDCGGFTLLNTYGDYPFSVEAYLNLVARTTPDYYATMDYPCEPEISRSLGLMTNKERIDKTVELADIILDYHDSGMVGVGQPVPVIQGYELDEYLYCIEQHDRHNTIRPYMAVGSMCRRLSKSELEVLLPTIKEAAHSVGCDRLHFFGLKLSPALGNMYDIIYSMDSAVALDAYDSKLREQRGGRRWPRGKKEKKAAFFSFFNRLNKLDMSYITEEKEWAQDI